MRRTEQRMRDFSLRLRSEYPGLADVHTHILPGIDDGSPDEGESLRLLRAIEEQGILCVIATPHYYPTEQSPESFLQKRGEALERLETVCDTGALRLGAEVQYFRGISRMEKLPELCLQNSNILLLELPTVTWTDAMLREVAELQDRNGLQVLAAHIERYFNLQSKQAIKQLADCGIKFQVNADSFLTGTGRRRLFRMLKNGEIFCIGSDCHSMDERPPRMAQAFAAIEKRLGAEALKTLEQNCKQLLE